MRPATRPSAVEFALASPADDADLRRLLRTNPTAGAISVSFEREPNYFHGVNLAGGEDRIIIAREHGRLVCLGRCTTRPAWINGDIRRVAYLAELRLDHGSQGRLDILRGGYHFFQTRPPEPPADLCFTSIAADNFRARRLLERGVRGLPRYDHVTDFATLLVPTAPQPRAAARLTTGSPAEVAAFFHEEGRRTQLAAAWGENHLSAGTAPLPSSAAAQVILRLDRRIVAAAVLWDQRPFRQTVIRRYSPLLDRVRRCSALLAPLFRFRPLPAPGTVLSHAFLSPLHLAAGHEPLLPILINAARHLAFRQGVDYLTLGFAAADPRLLLARKHFRRREYATRLYLVRWPGEDGPRLDGRPIFPDVALL